MTLASLGLPGMALADTGHLTWQHKTETQSAPVSSGGQDYPVPPSPYGQVGDPFARTLNWSGKGRAQQQQPPQPEPQPQPRPVAAAPAQPPRQPAPTPVPQRSVEPPHQNLANIEPLPVPQHPVPQVTAPVPVPQPRPVTVPEAALKPDLQTQAAKPPVKPQAAPQKPVPQAPAVAAVKPAPAQPAPVVAPSQPAPAQTSNGYQVPSTSKYAARIASARANAAKQEADATPPATAKPAVKTDKKPEAAKATVPAPTPQMATEETDHVFIPGEQYKNASDAPRLYSLHRAYGLTPDPITVDHNATGAILDTADLDKVEEAKDDKASDDTSSGDSGKTDDSSTAKTADATKADTRKVTQ